MEVAGMADPKLIQEWLQKADEDLGFAASIIEDGPYFSLLPLSLTFPPTCSTL